MSPNILAGVAEMPRGTNLDPSNVLLVIAGLVAGAILVLIGWLVTAPAPPKPGRGLI